jgi:hypothetical protein
VWGVGFYPFSGKKCLNFPPRSLPGLALFDFKKA